ncbi:hypothetical protein E2C01_036956 [Portunus trituberculatus]|uniref:Uncharacterized protein n=1 Tax=Portunus trituberculatus TaxID=210409 RepID=A0A5B7FA44_PORTR|nr:hypothetical protein [Portunus trituberculatus]
MEWVGGSAGRALGPQEEGGRERGRKGEAIEGVSIVTGPNLLQAFTATRPLFPLLHLPQPQHSLPLTPASLTLTHLSSSSPFASGGKLEKNTKKRSTR